MWRPATATRRSPLHVAGATSPQRTTSRSCWPKAEPGRGGNAERHLSDCGCRAASLRKRYVRRGGFHLRRDVRAEPEEGGHRDVACLPPRRQDWHGELDAEGFIGQLFKTLGSHCAAARREFPAQWGSRAWIEEVFGGRQSITINDRAFVFRYRSPEHFVEFFRTYYGPVHKAFLALDHSGQAALAPDLHTTIGRFNTATDGSMRAPFGYAEVIISKA